LNENDPLEENAEPISEFDKLAKSIVVSKPKRWESATPSYKRNCKWCSNRFTFSNKRRVYCSDECRKKAKDAQIQKWKEKFPEKIREYEKKCKSKSRPIYRDKSKAYYSQNSESIKPKVSASAKAKEAKIAELNENIANNKYIRFTPEEIMWIKDNWDKPLEEQALHLSRSISSVSAQRQKILKNSEK
jgi:hypothetical protein